MNLVQLFLDHLKVDKGSSPHTLQAYERDLKQFETTLISLGLEPGSGATHENISSVSAKMKSRNF